MQWIRVAGMLHWARHLQAVAERYSKPWHFLSVLTVWFSFVPCRAESVT